MPRFSDDDVVNFMVTEALSHVYAKHREEVQKEEERKAKIAEWKKGAPGSG